MELTETQPVTKASIRFQENNYNVLKQSDNPLLNLNRVDDSLVLKQVKHENPSLMRNFASMTYKSELEKRKRDIVPSLAIEGQQSTFRVDPLTRERFKV